LITPIPDYTTFTLTRYLSIIRFKTAYYSFHLPIGLALLLAEAPPDLISEAEPILLALGEFFQIQDDYLDCFGDAAALGKVGTDIMEKKCTWLAVMALKKCSDAQRRIFESNYGVNPEIIKKLYEEL
jgi:farnesyl diphosphate synthase